MLYLSSADAAEYRDGAVADQGLKSDAETKAYAGWGLCGAAAAAAAGGILLLLLDPGEAPPPAAVTPAMTDRSAGLLVSGRW